MIVALLLSLVQALTEFLPVSSSAHLALVPWAFHLKDYGLGFDAALHLGTALALLVFFWRDFWTMLVKKDRLLWYIVVASIPAGVIGFFGDKWIEEHLHEASYAPLLIAIGMLVFAFVLYVVDKQSEQAREVKNTSLADSLFVGVAQVLALIPGVSRSGITITAARFRGYKRADAARISFLLATPITVAAGLYKTLELVSGKVSSPISTGGLLVSILVCFIAGLAVIKWLLDYLRSHSLNIFVWYRVVIGIIVILVWLMRR